MYNQTILDYFKDMKNAGRVKGANAVGKALHKKSGDEIHIFINVDESGIAQEASFKAYGSVIAIAVGSLACQLIKGKQVKEIVSISKEDFENVFGKNSKLEYAYILVLESILNALKYYYKKLEDNK